jgi:hypothetical protein
MPDYQNGKIYMIWAGDERYYGSTTQSLAVRMAGHRADYKRKEGVSSSLLFEKYGLENCKIELVELFPCNSKEELTQHEGHYIRNNKCVNHEIPGRTREEWVIDNSEKIKENDKKRYTGERKEKLLEQAKKRNEINKEEISKQRKKYREANKEIIAQKNKEWREANKEKCNAYDKAKYERKKLSQTLIQSDQPQSSKEAASAPSEL